MVHELLNICQLLNKQMSLLQLLKSLVGLSEPFSQGETGNRALDPPPLGFSVSFTSTQ